MTSPANELAEQWEHEEMWYAVFRDREIAKLCSAIEFYSGMEFERAVAVFRDQRDEKQWDLMLERSE